MGRIRTFRDPKFSLFQSAVDEAVRRRSPVVASERPDTDDPIVDSAAELAARIEKGEMPRPKVAVLPEDADLGDAILYCARFAMELAEARLAGRALDVERYRGPLSEDSGQCDPDWLDVAEEYARNLILHFGDVPYRRHRTAGDFIIDGKLPAKARIALLSNWGTGDAAARRVLAAIAARKPDVLIHLGDIYYSGTSSEIQNYFLAPLREKFDPARTPCFSLAGNHDMYCGGRAYYDELLPALGQPASYFCLRNDHWQFIALDTGLHDRIPGGGPTCLEDSEAAWLAAQIENAAGRQIILLSHHPLFSAYEKIHGTFCNERLYLQVQPLLDRVTAWFWGHEHRVIIYDEFDALAPGLRRGRAIGCCDIGAAPAPVFPHVRTQRVGGAGYAIVELEDAAARIAYYEETGTDPLYEEVISSTVAARCG